MPRKIGVISKVYHNYNDKFGKPLSDDKKTHKFLIEDELYIIKGKECPDFIKEGKTVTVTFNVWRPQGQDKDFYYVMRDPTHNNLLVQEITTTTQTYDDPLPDQKVSDNNVEFDPNALEKELTNPQALKEEQIFCTALLKSSIEGGYLEPTKDNLDKMILMFKDIYKRNFIH